MDLPSIKQVIYAFNLGVQVTVFLSFWICLAPTAHPPRTLLNTTMGFLSGLQWDVNHRMEGEQTSQFSFDAI